MFVEEKLTERIGDAGKKLHTARSRNDQVALDLRLYLRDSVTELRERLKALCRSLIDIAKANVKTYMPAYTHMQKAQPTTLAHHLSAYVEMFLRDIDRLSDCRKRINVMPLGSCACTGTTFPIRRERVAELLDFPAITANALDGVSDRDFVIEYIAALSVIMMHLSRFNEELIYWATDEFRFVTLDDRFSTGSSIMPQKKNPDVSELIRGKTGRVYGDLMTMLTVMKGLPLAYNKDMQEDKEAAFDAEDTVREALEVFTAMLPTLHFNTDVMRRGASAGTPPPPTAPITSCLKDSLSARHTPSSDVWSYTARKTAKRCTGCRLTSSGLSPRCSATTLPMSYVSPASSAAAACREGRAPRTVAAALRRAEKKLEKS